jgi:hypothetical protein
LSIVNPQYWALYMISGITVTRDDGSTPATVKAIYAGAPEDLVRLFVTLDYDVVATIGEPNLDTGRFLQDKQVYETFDVPVKVQAINKYNSGTLVSTAPTTLFKAVDSIMTVFENNPHPNNTVIKVTRGSGAIKRVAGIEFHEVNLTVQVRSISV